MSSAAFPSLPHPRSTSLLPGMETFAFGAHISGVSAGVALLAYKPRFPDTRALAPRRQVETRPSHVLGFSSERSPIPNASYSSSDELLSRSDTQADEIDEDMEAFRIASSNSQ